MTKITYIDIHSYRDKITKEELSRFSNYQKTSDILSQQEDLQQVIDFLKNFGTIYTIKDMIEHNMFDIPQSRTTYPYIAVSDLNYKHILDASKSFPYKSYQSKYQSTPIIEDALSWTYGVADNLDQIHEYITKTVKSIQKDYNSPSDEVFILVTVTPIFKNDQPSTHGWRWHKWGEYIGIREPKCEYLYDEPEIDTVFVFGIKVFEKNNK